MTNKGRVVDLATAWKLSEKVGLMYTSLERHLADMNLRYGKQADSYYIITDYFEGALKSFGNLEQAESYARVNNRRVRHMMKLESIPLESLTKKRPSIEEKYERTKGKGD